METLLLPVSMAACLLSGIINKCFINRFGGNIRMYYLFSVATSLICAIILFLISGGFKASVFTLVLGLLFGFITTVQRIASMQAMNNGPYSYTSVITSLSTLIPTLSGKFIWGEKIYPIQYVGIFLMMLCLICSINFKSQQKAASLKWLIYCAIAFITTGLIGVMQRWHQSTEYKNELDEFLVIAFVISVIFSALGMISNKTSDADSAKNEKLRRNVWVWLIIGMLVSGACIAANNKLNLYLSGVMDTAIFFPIVNGGGLVLTSLAAFIIFKEKLSLLQWIGLVIGIIAVILLCNPFA